VARVFAYAALLAIVGGMLYGLVWIVRVTLRDSKGQPWHRAGWLSALVVGVGCLVALSVIFHAP
jgi:hypothetical protein